MINGPLDAARRALSLRAEVTASIVVVDLDRTVPTAARYSWAAQVIAALEPAVVWAAVDGGRKTEDLRGELDRLGPIDALVVTGASSDVEPGQRLGPRHPGRRPGWAPRHSGRLGRTAARRPEPGAAVMMLRPATLALAALISSRALWMALVDHDLPLATAVIWFLVAVPISGLVLAALGGLMTAYRRANAPTSTPTAGADDAPA